MSGRVFILIGSLAASISVLAGALGAHAMAQFLGERAHIFETAVRYQMYHSLGLILVGVLWRRYRNVKLRRAGWAFLAGIVLFSGSLYLHALTDAPVFSALAPVGGLSFVIAWILLGLGVWQAPRRYRGYGTARARVDRASKSA